MDFTPSPKANEYLARMRSFIDAHIVPIEKTYRNENLRMNAGADWTEWRVPPVIEALKEKAREAGLWNLFLPSESGLSTLEYAPLAEMTGRFEFSAEVFNCNAPDTGNMEVLHHFGSEDQKEKWLKPLLAGKIRSVFCMSEPDVASSDATNIAGTIQEDGADLVLNGKKWWSTGVGHPNAKLAIFMGVSNPDADPHRRHSMVLVPLDTPGVRITRMLPTFGEYDPPYGHGEVEFNDVRVSKENVILGLGKGFLIAQGRLGPGRIHHSMRAIGTAERALELTILRASRREAFGKPLIKLGGNLEQIANARMAIDQARLLTLYAAWKIDRYGVKEAMTEISAIKVVAPNVLQSVVDHAIQIHGGAGLSHDVPLTNLFLMARALRLADGPDEVHRAMVARHELAKYRVREAEIA
ncbi:acyl-CoA dehydrogenase family protein [Burkholderia sp. LMG 13014]|uniref:acyl-CoA dehydrogenase family protein n=1 Tax=Burkholderia sp. LMG 13014 TaxID=2709306 RepID=UPI001963A34B|nr:acyl-CoA dehydrogenase family protein [Burkholderia sp. LMG 13014]